MNRAGLLLGTSLSLLLLASLGCAPTTYSTDVPVEFHKFLSEKYEGRTAWTRLTLQDERLRKRRVILPSGRFRWPQSTFFAPTE